MDKLEEKSTFWKITHLWWLILPFIFLIHWISLIIVGLEVRKKKWVLFGILYSIPVFIFMSLNGQISGITENVVMSLFFFSWFATIIHSIAIRKEYLYLLANKKNVKSIKYKNKPTVKKRSFARASSKHQSIYNALLIEQKAIRKRYDEISPIDQPNFIDLIVMLDYFIEQAQALIKKEEDIDEIIAGFNIEQIEDRIKELNKKINQTNKINLKNEYEQIIEKYKKQRQIYTDFTNKKNIIKLKLESSLISLKEIKYDLIKIDYVVDKKEPHFLFEKLDEISKEMDTYIEVMTETYNELNT